MLENIREGSQGWIAKTILGLVILTFALAGIGSYTNSVDTSVAEVNGEKITQNDFNKAYQAQRNRMEQQFGNMFETLSANSNYMANFRTGVLDNLINEKLIDQNIENLSIRVSDGRLKQTIREMAEFKVDGVFDNNRYLAIINQAGFFQASDFRDYLRVEMTRRQLSQALVSSEFNLPYQETMFAGLQNQKRDIRFATISAEQFKADIKVTDEEINEYYQQNQARFQNQEQVKVNYIALDVNLIAKDIVVTDADVEIYYQDNIENYRQSEQRRLAHILVEFGDDKGAAEDQAASILARVKKGEEFSTLAKELSADTYSGEKGGDLDWVELGVMGDAFDESAFALSEVGSVTDIVTSDYGFHIIKLTDLKAEHTKPLVDLREELHAKISQERAQDKFFELQQDMAQLSFELPDSLDDAAAAVNVTVETSAWLTRNGNPAPFDNNKLIEAAFSDIVLTEQANSDVIEVSDELAVVIRLNEYQAATVKPLTDVKEQIEVTLVAKKATEKTKALVDDLLVQFKAGTDLTEQLVANNAAFVLKAGISRTGTDVDRIISNEAFELPHPKDGTVSASTLTLSNGDMVLLEVQAVNAGEQTVDTNLAQQQTSELAQSAYQSYVDALKVDAKITRKVLTEAPTQY
ncbi:MAG: SurA N-terminal domain-containing protein [Alteromonadaceae bacterium]|nr:SurA N-terminal domain-containing protein [Alteromonadaceae bacterium]